MLPCGVDGPTAVMIVEIKQVFSYKSVPLPFSGLLLGCAAAMAMVEIISYPSHTLSDISGLHGVRPAEVIDQLLIMGLYC